MENIRKVYESFEDDRDSRSEIGNFFSGKTIFITGGTGFLGQSLIERLLSASSTIGKIYILIRAKHGYSPEARVARLLSKPIFEHLSNDDKTKVVPVIGELSENDFGLRDDVLEKLTNEVNIVFHCAATIKFNTYLPIAIKTNLVGTKIVIDFVKKLRHLVSFIHVSTAFCNSCYVNQDIKEQIYASKSDPYEMIKMIEDSNIHFPHTGTEELRKILQLHPNTYTFTKQLAENLILSELRNYPVGIVRPSVVYGTHRKPFAGYVGNASSGHIGFVAGFSKGLFRTMGGDTSSIMDLIPLDFVTNSTVVLSWYVASHEVKEPEVIHCTSGDLNPLSFGEYCKILNDASKKHPNDYIICQPRVKVRNGLRYTIFIYLFNFLPAYLFWLPEHYIWRRKALRKTLDYVRIFVNGIKAFDYFTNKSFHYRTKNALRILDSLNEEDKKKYNYNCSRIYLDWGEYMENQVIGIRRFFFRESTKTSMWHIFVWHAFGWIQFFWYIVAFYVLNSLLSYFLQTPVSVGIVTCLLLFVKWI